MTSFGNAVVAITGAGSGIGAGLATEAARKGSILAISDVNAEGLAETAAAARRLGAEVFDQQLDVADREAVNAWSDAVMERFGRVDIVINNAGVALGASVATMNYEDFRWLMNINFWGVVHGTQAFLPRFREAGRGHVVNLSSVFGLVPIPSQSAYCASKFAVRGFTESLAIELSLDAPDVKVTCVHPGGIRTNIIRNGRFDATTPGFADRAGFIDNFDKAAQTTPTVAAQTIIAGVERDELRVLIGRDAKVFAGFSRLPVAAVHRVVRRGAAMGAKALGNR